MRLVVQRVKEAKVTVGKKKLGLINSGLFVLVGIAKEDKFRDAEIIAEKLAKLRVMADDKGKMNLSVKDVNGKILVVSQFTLISDTSGGNRPSFIGAAEPEFARKVYDKFIERLRNLGIGVETGSFGDYMRINAELDGPVTIVI